MTKITPGSEATQAAHGHGSDDSMNSVVYETGVTLSELRLPVGYWLLMDDNDNVFVSGADLAEVFEAGRRMGLDMDELSFDRVPSPDNIDFLERGGSVFHE